MNHTTRTLLVAALLLCIPATTAQVFDATSASQSPHRVAVSIIDTNTTYVQTTRDFSLSNETGVRVAFVQSPPAGYKADIELKNGASSYQIVGSDVDDTTPTPTFTVANNGTMRATVDVPTVANRDEGLVTLRFSISLPTGTGAGGTGGQQVPSIVHVLEVLYYNPANDTDADGLLDDWEKAHFGNLAQTAQADPDNDGYSNEQEQAAETDPANRGSTPASTVIEGGAGGGNVNDVEFATAWVGFFVMCVLLFLGALFIKKSKSEKRWIAVSLPLALAVLVGFGLLFLVERFDLLPGDWAWWSVLRINGMELAAFCAAAGAVLIVASIAAAKVQQKFEKHIAIAAGVAIALIAGLGYLLFGVLDVPFPEFSSA